ncbi:hypothetical protein VNX24_12790, partial [Citrobacter farmeri]|uniref:hypothetical protein n=1 Tax=Citrobacter farmeri TaxID=67824 RepID=UPI002DB63806
TVGRIRLYVAIRLDAGLMALRLSGLPYSNRRPDKTLRRHPAGRWPDHTLMPPSDCQANPC